MNLRELLALILPARASQQSPPPTDGFNAERPWDSAVMQAPPVQAAPVIQQQQAAPLIDPFTYAQQLEERQRAAAQLSSPVSPALSILDLLTATRSK